jgi:ABC-type lipoprotein release transport system permease subunit
MKIRSDSMATYKSGYKRKKSNGKFLKYTFIGMGVVVVTLIMGLVLYNIFSDELKYSSFEEITSFQEITTQPEQQYLVYYYGENCGACISIKGSVLDYFGHIDVKVYVIESSNVDGVNLIRNPDTQEEMRYTPTLLTIRDGVLIDMNVGADTVVDILKETDLGTYSKID